MTTILDFYDSLEDFECSLVAAEDNAKSHNEMNFLDGLRTKFDE